MNFVKRGAALDGSVPPRAPGESWVRTPPYIYNGAVIAMVPTISEGPVVPLITVVGGTRTN